MAARHHDRDVLARVRREQRMQGRPSAFSSLRIVFSAAAITVAILLAAFGAIGMLLLARAPQEPIARQPDPASPSVLQTEVPQAPVAPASPPELVANEPLILPAPESVPFPSQEQLEKEAAVLPPPAPEEEPETTAAIPDATAEPDEVEEPAPQAQPKGKLRRKVQPPQRQRAVRRAVQRKSEQRSDNPLLQLFGIRQYR